MFQEKEGEESPALRTVFINQYKDSWNALKRENKD